MRKEDPESRVKFEGDSLDEISSWPKAVKENVGGDLFRVERREQPLDHKYLGDQLHELRDQRQNVWYRLLYWFNEGWIYVLHCFTKKSNKIAPSDLDLAKKRRTAVIAREDPPYEAPAKTEGEEKSA